MSKRRRMYAPNFRQRIMRGAPSLPIPGWRVTPPALTGQDPEIPVSETEIPMEAQLDEAAFDFQDSGSGERGCGRRERGGLYAVTEMGYGGVPITDWLIDPPEPVTERMMSEWGIAPRDVSLRSYPGADGQPVYYLLDWIGAGDGPHGDGYWNPSDILAEAIDAGKGFSGRVPVDKIDWTKVMQGDTRRWLIAPHAIITNARPLWKERVWERYRGECVTFQAAHNLRENPPDFCDSIWWETVEGGAPMSEDPADRRVIRTIGSFTYPAYRAPSKFEPVYQAGLIAKIPFHLEIIVDPLGRRHEQVAEKLERAGQAYKFAEE